MLKVLLVWMAALQSPTDLDTALDRAAAVKPGDGAAYVAARDAVLAFGKDATPALAERGAAGRWTEAGWTRALVAEACRIRLAEPELAAEVDRLEGLDPERYRLFRHGKPMVLPALARRGAAAVPLLIERWRWTIDLRTYSDGAAGALERETLRNAILTLPGQVPDPRARHFLGDVLGSGGADAAVSFASTSGIAGLPRITAILDDATQPAGLREACARSLGRIPDVAALDAIRKRLEAEKTDLVRRSYLTGLGLLGSKWGWEARGPQSASLAEAIRRGCAETLVGALRTHPGESETVGLALSLTAWEPSLAAVDALAGDAGASPEARAAAARILPALKKSLSRK
jgi:hypothetical protein